MGVFGFGTAIHGRLIRSGLSANGAQGPDLRPALDWDGTAASGFATTPSDPARTTAKPAVRLLEPDHQFFTDELTVGVAAFANVNGTLIGGIDRVRFHFEGTQVDVLAPTFRTLTRYDGSAYKCRGYWVTLKKPAGTEGAANLYAEAIPADATMQNRVIGPYLYHPVDTLHDLDVTVGASGDYSTILAALQYIRGQTPQNPRVTLLDDGDYPVANGSPRLPTGYCTIEPASGVSAKLITETPNNGDVNWRPRFDRLWFKNVTFDMSTLDQIYNDGDGDHVFERCRFEVAGGRSLRLGSLAGASYLVRENPWFLECDFFGTYESGNSPTLVRGCTFDNTWGDLISNCPAVVHCISDDTDSADAGGTIDTITITYSGSGTATWSRERINAADDYTRYTFKVDGSSVGTFDAWERPEQESLDDGKYWNEDFVAFIDGLTDFSATSLIPNETRAAWVTNIPGSTTNSEFTDQAIGSGITAVSDFDFHTDGIVYSASENNIVYANVVTRCKGQVMFLKSNTSGGAIKDTVIANNVFDFGADGWEDGASTLSQMGDTDFMHTIVCHNSWNGQRVNLDMGAADEADAYTLISNNVAPEFIGDIGEEASGTNNHVFAGSSTATGLTNTVSAGDRDSLYADWEALDFTPAGALLTNLKAPVVNRDLNGKERGVTAPVGAGT